MEKENTYLIQGVYKDGGDFSSIEWFVNGKAGKLPPKLKQWITRDFINEKL
jgi:hypothetical protein